MYLTRGIIMVAIVREATGRAENMGGFSVKRKKKQGSKKEWEREREEGGRTAREGRECVVYEPCAWARRVSD